MIEGAARFEKLLARLSTFETNKERGEFLIDVFKHNQWLVEFFRFLLETHPRIPAAITTDLLNKAIARSGVAEAPIEATRTYMELAKPKVSIEVTPISGHLSEITGAPVPLMFGKLVIDGAVCGDVVLNRDFNKSTFAALNAIGIKIEMQKTPEGKPNDN